MKKRLVIEVSDRFHEDLKKRAEKMRLTIRSYVITALIDYIKKEFDERNTH